MTIDYSLMFVTDERIVDDERFFEILHAALEGGVSMVQLREKKASTRFVYKRALTVKALCKKHRVPFVVNDRVDVALAVDADGVHVGQDDMPINVARKLLGSNKILGLSVSCEREVLQAAHEEVDYLGASPIFATNTKRENLAEPLGLVGLAAMSKLSNKPIVAIGGITTANAKAVMQHGAQGVAVVSEISQTENSQENTKILRRIICKTGMKV